MSSDTHYRQPGVMVRRLMNPLVVLMMRLGVSVWGSRILEVKGRTSGEPRRTPVNLLEVEDSVGDRAPGVTCRFARKHLDSRDLGANSFTMTSNETCGLALF